MFLWNEDITFNHASINTGSEEEKASLSLSFFIFILSFEANECVGRYLFTFSTGHHWTFTQGMIHFHEDMKMQGLFVRKRGVHLPGISCFLQCPFEDVTILCILWNNKQITAFHENTVFLRTIRVCYTNRIFCSDPNKTESFLVKGRSNVTDLEI